MAKKNHRRGNRRMSLAVLAGFMPLATEVYQGVQAEGFAAVPKRLGKLAGYDAYTGRFGWTYMVQAGVLPILAGILVHKFASRLGVNRAISKVIPFVNI